MGSELRREATEAALRRVVRTAAQGADIAGVGNAGSAVDTGGSMLLSVGMPQRIAGGALEFLVRDNEGENIAI